MNVAKDYNPATDISYNRQSGMRASAYEHLIPEKLFTDQTQPNAPQAISAVKALAIAASQGQKIYTITRANQDILLPQINVYPDVMTEMQNALSIGKEVTVHQSPITQSGWTGTGYIIADPVTGAGAYKISGGANGAWFSGFFAGVSIGAILSLIGIGAATLVGGTYTLFILGGSILILSAFLLLIDAVITSYLINFYSGDNSSSTCFAGGLSTGITVSSFGAGYLITQIVNYIFGIQTSTNNLLSC